MKSLNLVLALLLGGITAGALALNYHWSVLLAVPLGAVVGGLVFNPREVLAALKRAVGEVLGHDYQSTLRQGGREIVNTIGFLVGCALGIKIISVYGTFIPWWMEDPIHGSPGFLALIAVGASAFVMLLVGMADSNNDDRDWIFGLDTRLKSTGFRGVDAGLIISATCLVAIPSLLAVVITRLIPTMIIVVVVKIADSIDRCVATMKAVPTIFFRFVELAATHDRLVVMASIATGSLAGIWLGSVILCGIASMFVGLTATFVAKFIVQARRATAM